MALEDIDARASFLEMGFDSLFLAQASLRVKSEFKVRVTFRQFFEEAPTLEALAHYIDSHLPPDAFPAPAPDPPPVPVAVLRPSPLQVVESRAVRSGLTASPGGAQLLHMVPRPSTAVAATTRGTAKAGTVARAPAPTSGRALERVIQLQLQVMSEQLRLLGAARVMVAGGQAALTAHATTRPRSSPPVVTATAMPEPSFVSAAATPTPSPASAALPAASAAMAPATASRESDVVPFTEAQLEVWLGSQMSETASCSFNEVVGLDLRGRVDASALQDALSRVVARHESLRMTVATEPLGLRLAPRLAVPLVVRDVSALPPTDRDAALQEALRAGDTEPFDLTRGPLLRLTLVTLAPEHHVLVIAAHHLVCDGWSFGIVLRDLGLYYSAAIEHSEPALAPPLQARQFALDSVVEQRHEGARAEAFWLSQFTTVPDPLELPADRPRPAVRSSRGGRIGVSYDVDLLRGAKALATAQRATLFTTLLAVYETLIYRLTGQEDFVVGIPVAGQALLDGQDLVAHCVNFVPLRATLTGASTFSEHLAHLRRQSLDLNEYQHFTYASLLAKLRLPRDLSRNLLVAVGFTVEPAFTDLPFQGLTAHALTMPRATSKRDFHINIRETDSGLQVEADYNTDLFNPETIQRWLESYRCLLAAAVATPDARLSDLSLMFEADRQCLLTSWNETAVTYPSERLIHQLVEGWARQSPAALALVCEERRLTWAQVNQRANQLSRLLARKGVTRGDIVALCFERSVDFIVAMIGVHKAGAAYLPLDPANPPERLEALLKDASARAIVTEVAFLQRLPASAVPIVCMDRDGAALAREAATDPGITVAPEDLAYVIYTSGSTGQPKGVAVEHRQLLNYTWAVSERLALPAGCSYALVSTVAADLGNTAIFPALATGGVLHVVAPARASDGRALAQYFDAEGVDVLKITPSHLAALVSQHPSRALLPRRCLVLGGEAARPTWVAELQQLAPDCAILNHYGPTETTVGALTYRVRGDAGQLTGDGLPIGKPLGNLRAYVLDAAGAPVPIGVTGELFIGGAGVARGYLNRPEFTAERFLPDPFAGRPDARMYRTGDRARWRPEGVIEFLGRADNQVKVRGFRVELGEIEATLRAHAAVREAVVLLREDAPGDARLVAYVTGASVPAATLRDHLKRTLPDHAIPSAFVAIDAWPLTPNGKLDRKALPPPAAENRADPGEAFVAPSTPMELRLAAIWTDLLGIRRIGARDDFFLLGGHSLLAMRLVHRVHQEFGIALPPAALFQHTVLADLARHLDPPAPHPVTSDAPAPTASTMAVSSGAVSAAQVAMPPRNVLVQMQAGGDGTPFFWVHGVGGEVFSYMQISRHLGATRPVYGFSADWSQLAAQRTFTLEDMAAHYVRELRAFRPTGPYHLGGFCSAAMLALEMARQLEADGQKVGVLAVMDYDFVPADAPRLTGLRSLLLGLRNLPVWVRDDAMLSGIRELLGRARSRLRHLSRRAHLFGRAASAWGAGADFRDDVGMWHFPDHQVAMLKTHHQAIRSYQPKPFSGRVTLFLPRAAPLFGPWPPAHDPMWEQLARGGVEVHWVRGSHSTMLGEPFAAALAAGVNGGITESERRVSAPSALPGSSVATTTTALPAVLG